MPAPRLRHIAIIALLGAFGPATAATLPQVEPTACAGIPDIDAIHPRLRCGIVRVPRDHAHPDGPTFGLAIVVIASQHQPALPDPVIYISGGPGSPLTIFTAYQAAHPYAADRDLILVDQRGTGRSEPRLCPDIQRDLVSTMLAILDDPTPANLAANRTAHAACRAELIAHDIDPDTFGTQTTVEDLEWVRRALNVVRWNVVGESYGTTVAMTLLARHPQPIRTAVLDSLYPPDAALPMPWSQRVALARTAFFTACDADRACTATNPPLTQTYRETIAQLAQSLPILPLPPTLAIPGDQTRLTPSLFEEIIGRLVYYPSNYAGLPALIRAAHDGNLAPTRSALIDLLTEADRGNDGAYTAVECRDRPHDRDPAPSDPSPLDQALLAPGICPEWSTLGPPPEIPDGTAIPTLILAGQFDPNLPPDQSRHIADRLGPLAQWVLFPGIGHSVRHFSPCAQALVAAFIQSPAERLDRSCTTPKRP